MASASVVALRKDRNVRRSSHGKFKTVAELVEHQQAHAGPVPSKPKPVQARSENWLSRDPQRGSYDR